VLKIKTTLQYGILQAAQPADVHNQYLNCFSHNYWESPVNLSAFIKLPFAI